MIIRRFSSHNDRIERPRLYSKLDAWRMHRILFVRAPAGYGKTTLVARWLEHSDADRCSAWRTLDERDADPRRVLESIRTLDRTHDALVVLDDLHAVGSHDAATNLITRLITDAPPHIHFIVLTRRAVNLPDEAPTLSANDLRFTDEEAHALLASMHADDAAMTITRAAGWPLALHRAAHAEDPWLTCFFENEVLAPLEDPVRDFLQRIAVLERVDAQSCAAITGVEHAGALLAQAAGSGCPLFTDSDDARDARYRFHPLFRAALLLAQRTALSEEEITRLHFRAAQWNAAHGHTADAARCFLRAREEDAAAHLVEREVRLAALRGDTRRAQQLLDLLPVTLVHQRARLILDRCLVGTLIDNMSLLEIVEDAAMRLEALSLDPSERRIHELELTTYRVPALMLRDRLPDAEHLLRRAANEPAHPDDLVQANLAYEQMYIARLRSDQNAVQKHAAQALTLARRAGFESLFLNISREQGRTAMNLGNSAQAQEYFDGALELIRNTQPFISIDLCSLLMSASENAYLRNDLARALTYQQHGIMLAGELHDDQMHDMLETQGILIAHAMCTPGQAVESDVISRTLLPRRSLQFVGQTVVRIRMLLRVERTAEAWAQAAVLGLTPASIPNRRDLRRITAYLEVYVAHGVDLAAIAPLLDSSIAVARTTDDRLHLLQLLLIAARRFHRIRKPRHMRESLDAALDLITETGYVRPLLDMPELLHAAHSSAHPAARRICAQAGLRSQDIARAALTPQELRCMELLLDSHAYADIARIEGISINTVRTHVKKLYRKLGVGGQEELKKLF